MPAIIRDVVEQHAEEAAFLWLLRSAAVYAHNYTLDDLAGLDSRIDAHLDGLLIAGDDGWAICNEALGWDEPGEVFAATYIACASRRTAGIDRVLELAAESDEFVRPATAALGWLPYEAATPLVAAFLEARSPVIRRIGLGAGAGHRLGLGERLNRALADPEPLVRSRALRAVGELARDDLTPILRTAWSSDDPRCRFWAGWSAALLGDPGAYPVLWEAAWSGGPLAERACDLAGRRIPPAQALAWHRELVETAPGHRPALMLAASAGNPAIIPWLIEEMHHPELARRAGDAFSAITGVDLHHEDLEGEAPEGFDAGPTEDPDDEDVAMDPDEDLPWPDPDRVERWWSAHRSRFTDAGRYLAGRPIGMDAVATILRTGTQRLRAAAALELFTLQPGYPLFEVRARARVQRRALAS